MSVNVRGLRRLGWVETAFGTNLAGAVIASFAVKGDIVVGVYNIVTGATAASLFETTVSVTGQVQQTSATNQSANEFDFFIQPQS